jgi:hypothetical protein
LNFPPWPIEHSRSAIRSSANTPNTPEKTLVPMMHLDDLLTRYFHDTDLSRVSPDVLASGIEHCLVNLGLEQDRGKRFALWALLHMLGSAPDLDVAFKDPNDQDAARTFMDMLAAGEASEEQE